MSTFTELPPVTAGPQRAAYGMTVVGRTELKECCLAAYSELRPSVLGTQLRCSRCQNLMTVKESKMPLWKNPDAPVIPGEIRQLEDNVSIHMLQYTKPYWTMASIAEDLRKRGYDNGYAQDTLQYITVVQKPANWFVRDSLQAITPANGVTMLIGILKAGFIGRSPTDAQLSSGLNNPNTIGYL